MAGGSTLTTGTGGITSTSGNLILTANSTDISIESGKNLTMAPAGAGTFTTGTGAVSLNGNVTVPATKTVTAPNYISNVATGTQPYAATSTTVNINLNADQLDGWHASGMLVLLYNSEADVSGTGNSTAVKSYAVPANTYSKIMVEAEIGLVQTGAVDANWNFALNYGGTVKETIPLRVKMNNAAYSGTISGIAKYSEAFAGPGTVQIDVSFTTQNGTWWVRGFRVYGVI
jgi:hypothetical protein